MATKAENEDMDLLLKCIEDSENCDQYCNDIVKSIQEGEKQFLTVIEGLESELISIEVNTRLKGVKILSTILNSLPADQLKEDEVTHITSFLCAKLKDHHSLIPVILTGLRAIVNMKYMSAPCIRQIVDSLSVDVQNHVQAPKDRLVIYEILESLLMKRLSALKELGTVFVFAVIRLVESECNAKNLDLVFSFLPRMLSNFTLGHLAEDMFEAIACYFPIDVPTEGKDVIPRQTLAHKLQKCLISNTELAKFTLPLLLEKLNSDLSVAKKDSLCLLETACETGAWGAMDLKSFLRELGFSLQREANSLDDVGVTALRVIAVLAKTLAMYPDFSEHVTLHSAFVQHILDMNLHPLQQVESKDFATATRKLYWLAKGSKVAATQVCRSVVPVLTVQYQARADDSKQQATILSVLTTLISDLEDKSEFIESCSALYFDAASPSQPVELREQGFLGFRALGNELSSSDRSKVCQLLQSALVAPQISNAASLCLCALANKYPQEIMEAEFFESLFSHSDKEDCSLAMNALGSVVMNADIEDTRFLSLVVPRILETSMGPNNNQQICAVEAMQRLARTPRICSFLCSKCNAIQKLVQHWLLPESTPCLEALEPTSTLLSTLVSSQSAEYQSGILTECWPSLGLEISTNEAKDMQVFSTPDKALMGLSLLGSLHPEVEIPGRDALTSALVRTALTAEDSMVRDSCGCLAACLFNKSPPDCEFSSLMNTINQGIKQNPEPAMALFMRITRALLLKGYSKFEDWMTKIIEFLVNPSLSSIAAGSFHLLVTEENSHLSTEKHATVRFLYKQRLSEYLPQLEVAHRSSEPSTKPNLLLVITHLMHIAPRQVLNPNLPQLVPLLICSLQLELPTIAVQAALACLQPLLRECSTHLESHLSDLTKPCIQLATQHPSMKVRIAALQCMALVPLYKLTNQLVAMKLDVVDGLRPALDDHKRLVRAAAVKACNHWHMVGALPDT